MATIYARPRLRLEDLGLGGNAVPPIYLGKRDSYATVML